MSGKFSMKALVSGFTKVYTPNSGIMSQRKAGNLGYSLDGEIKINGRMYPLWIKKTPVRIIGSSEDSDIWYGDPPNPSFLSLAGLGYVEKAEDGLPVLMQLHKSCGEGKKRFQKLVEKNSLRRNH